MADIFGQGGLAVPGLDEESDPIGALMREEELLKVQRAERNRASQAQAAGAGREFERNTARRKLEALRAGRQTADIAGVNGTTPPAVVRPPSPKGGVDEKKARDMQRALAPDMIDKILSGDYRDDHQRGLDQNVLSPGSPLTPSQSSGVDWESKKHADLGFSWGGAPTKSYRPGMDIRSGEFGQAPTEDSSRQDPHSGPSSRAYADKQSSGGGGFVFGGGGDIDKDTTPAEWQKRVNNPEMFSMYHEAEEAPFKARDRRLAEVETADPMYRERFLGDQRVGMAGEASRQKVAAEAADDMRKQMQYADIESRRARNKARLHADPEYVANSKEGQAKMEGDLDAHYDKEFEIAKLANDRKF